MWRGLFGKALWEIACLTGSDGCAGCRHLDTCAYPLLFETQGSVLPWAGASRAPSAWMVEPVLEGGRVHPADAVLSVDFVLIGRAQSHLPLVVAAWQRGLAKGIGTHRVAARLLSVWSLDGADASPACQAYAPDSGWQLSSNGLVSIPPVPANLEEVRLELLTPLRLKRNNDLVGPRELDAGVLLDAVVRRISLLARAHAGGFPKVDFHAMKATAKTLELDVSGLRWHDWTRFSSRQGETMQMGGLLGEVRLRGKLAEFWPFLYAAQWAHVGKATSFGLGRMRLLSQSLLR